MINFYYQVTSQAKYDDDSSSVIRNLEASYGLFKGKLDRYFLTTLSRNDLQSMETKLNNLFCFLLTLSVCSYL